MIEEHCEIVAVDIPTIELAGGSVRCMIAGIHLDRRRPLMQVGVNEAVEAINEDNPVTPDGRYVDGPDASSDTAADITPDSAMADV